MKRLLISVAIVLMAAPAFAFGPNNVLCWDKGPEPDIAKYKVYFGTATGVYGNPIDVGVPTALPKCAPKIGVALKDLGPLPQGTVFFAVTAEDTSLNESLKSAEFSGPFDSVAPGALKNLEMK